MTKTSLIVTQIQVHPELTKRMVLLCAHLQVVYNKHRINTVPLLRNPSSSFRMVLLARKFGQTDAVFLKYAASSKSFNHTCIIMKIIVQIQLLEQK